MATTGLDSFDRTVHQTNIWLGEIGDRLGLGRQHGYHALRAVLHTLRDRLLPGEAAKLASELPMLVRGIYYEGYKPDATPTKLRGRAEFLDQVQQRYELDVPSDPEKLVRAVFGVLCDHVSEGEIDKMRRMLPKDVAALFPQGAGAGAGR